MSLGKASHFAVESGPTQSPNTVFPSVCSCSYPAGSGTGQPPWPVSHPPPPPPCHRAHPSAPSCLQCPRSLARRCRRGSYLNHHGVTANTLGVQEGSLWEREPTVLLEDWPVPLDSRCHHLLVQSSQQTVAPVRTWGDGGFKYREPHRARWRCAAWGTWPPSRKKPMSKPNI